MYGWCESDFVRRGKGTPEPAAAPPRVVVRGPYRFVRNPMYVAVLSVLAGEALWTRSAALLEYGAIVALLFHAFVLLYEERTLKARFGGEYEAYQRSVPRWIPGIGRRR